jgi:hypothetical protein
MAATNGHNSPDRLDRIEGIIEALANRQQLIEDEFARLLRAQVVMADHMNQIDVSLKQLAEAQRLTEEQMKHTDGRMDALILTVDEVIRGRKRE